MCEKMTSASDILWIKYNGNQIGHANLLDLDEIELLDDKYLLIRAYEATEIDVEDLTE